MPKLTMDHTIAENQYTIDRKRINLKDREPQLRHILTQALV
jgi:hypothetical protein